MTANEMTLNSRRFKCPHCDAFSGHLWKYLWEIDVQRNAFDTDGGQRAIRDGDPEERTTFDHSVDGEWKASQCSSCFKHALWVGEDMVFPAAWTSTVVAAPHPEMPNDVAQLYREAVAVLPHSKRASAALSRAALEKLVKLLTSDMDKKAKMPSRLSALSRLVSPETAKGLQMIRFIGNEALHGNAEREDNEAVTLYLHDREGNELVGLLFRAMNDLVEQRISTPKKYDEYFEMMSDGFKEGIERSDAEHLTRQAAEGN